MAEAQVLGPEHAECVAAHNLLRQALVERTRERDGLAGALAMVGELVGLPPAARGDATVVACAVQYVVGQLRRARGLRACDPLAIDPCADCSAWPWQPHTETCSASSAEVARLLRVSVGEVRGG